MKIDNEMMYSYLTAKYKDFGRGEKDDSGRMLFDCWGLTRHARHYMLNLPLLESRAGEEYSKTYRSRNYNQQAENMVKTDSPTVGSIAALISRNGVCLHVALVIPSNDHNKLAILEAGPSWNIRSVPLNTWLKENEHREVAFYVDKDLP